MDGITNISEVDNRSTLSDRSYQSLLELAQRTVMNANELAETILQEAQTQAAAIIEKAEMTQKEAAKTMEEAKAAQKEAAKMLESIEERAHAAQKGANALIETLRNQMLSDVEIIRNRLFPSLESLSVEIGQGESAIKEKRESILAASQKLEASESHSLNSGESSDRESNSESKLALIVAQSGQEIESS